MLLNPIIGSALPAPTICHDHCQSAVCSVCMLPGAWGPGPAPGQPDSDSDSGLRSLPCMARAQQPPGQPSGAGTGGDRVIFVPRPRANCPADWAIISLSAARWSSSGKADRVTPTQHTGQGIRWKNSSVEVVICTYDKLQPLFTDEEIRTCPSGDKPTGRIPIDTKYRGSAASFIVDQILSAKFETPLCSKNLALQLV